MSVHLRFELKEETDIDDENIVEGAETMHGEPVPQPIVVEVIQSVTLGRGDDEVLTKTMGDSQSDAEFERQMAMLKNPHVDLSPYDAHHRGVSRKHARITIRNMRLTVADLGSTNGTYVNNQKLNANEEYTIKEGDELRLGFLSLTFTVI